MTRTNLDILIFRMSSWWKLLQCKMQQNVSDNWKNNGWSHSKHWCPIVQKWSDPQILRTNDPSLHNDIASSAKDYQNVGHEKQAENRQADFAALGMTSWSQRLKRLHWKVLSNTEDKHRTELVKSFNTDVFLDKDLLRSQVQAQMFLLCTMTWLHQQKMSWTQKSTQTILFWASEWLHGRQLSEW